MDDKHISGKQEGYNGRLLLESSKERWLRAEERASELLHLIQPNIQSELYRNFVADYVKTLITQNCSWVYKVETIGSTATKTYLPGCDIDLTVLCAEEDLKDSWYDEFRKILENEDKSATAKFSVKRIQYVPSEEVSLLKCTVGGVGVNISVNLRTALGSYCICEQADRLEIKQNHLLKRSIILIKAWCYHESQILDDIISPYALQTMILYIFQIFDSNSFAGPLEVFCRFLEFYSNFDWENLCVSLSGPIGLSAPPDMIAESTGNDSGELHLFDKSRTDFFSSFSECKRLKRNWPETFICKDFNVIDPFCSTNNLGRNVGKVNLFRIHSAFAYGAKMLVKLLYCEEDEVISKFDCFFKNTWDRHVSGSRSDALNTELSPFNPYDPLDGYEYLRKSFSMRDYS
ncbi:hypothetical protein MKW92_019795 [Papaver armeniacum]|nr:hypothetical protein MKW92_019795 [Papaver armeniacum]